MIQFSVISDHRFKAINSLCVLALCAFALTSCYNDAEEHAASSNSAFDVEKLFSADGCDVYRFEDGGRAHYFARCQGSTSVSETQRSRHGKHSTIKSHEVVTAEMQ